MFYDGRTGDEMHNAYALDYTKAYRKLFEKYKGEDHVLFSRSAAAGVQKYSCQFGGDQLSSFRGLTYAMNGNMRLQEAFLQLLLDFHSGVLMQEVIQDLQMKKRISVGRNLQPSHQLCVSME